MDNIKFINSIPIRNYGQISFTITEWCVLGDCMQKECHHCYPIKDCNKHELCINEGTCEFITIPKKI